MDPVLESFLLLLYDSKDSLDSISRSIFDNAVQDIFGGPSPLIDELFSCNLLLKSPASPVYLFSPLCLEFIIVLKNKRRRTSILQKMTTEDYILAIYYLSFPTDAPQDKTIPVVSMTDLARNLGLSNSSISEYIRSIEKDNLVMVIPRKGVSLTPQGLEMASKLIAKRTILFDFLNLILRIDKDLADVESHVLEHNTSPIVIERLKILLKQLKSSNFVLSLDLDS